MNINDTVNKFIYKVKNAILLLNLAVLGLIFFGNNSSKNYEIDTGDLWTIYS